MQAGPPVPTVRCANGEKNQAQRLVHTTSPSVPKDTHTETRILVDNNDMVNVPTDILQTLGQLLAGPVEGGAELQSYPALLRSLRRLNGVCEAARSEGAEALEAINAAYASILSAVKRHIGDDGRAEMERLGMVQRDHQSMQEVRIMLAQLNGWLGHVVSGMETKREAEQMLGGTLEAILSDSKMVAPAVEQPTPVGMYL